MSLLYEKTAVISTVDKNVINSRDINSDDQQLSNDDDFSESLRVDLRMNTRKKQTNLFYSTDLNIIEILSSGCVRDNVRLNTEEAAETSKSYLKKAQISEEV
ncbi:MAG: hypothetical protein M1836_005548 [Candelina mexicana]|nr:MAG: hypothetical protein M1836_005548 [Candelina mexicana]